MPTFNSIFDFVEVNLIHCLFPITATLILTKLLFKNRFDVKRALNVVSWIIISYTVISITQYTITSISKFGELVIPPRISGPYLWAYRTMIISSLLPLTLFNNRLASSGIFILFVGIMMKIGLHFERFVIIVTSLHRDHLETNSDFLSLIYQSMGLIFLQGVVIAIIILTITETLNKKILNNR